MRYTETSFGEQAPPFYGDSGPWTSISRMIPTTGTFIVEENGRQIAQQGRLFPANDATAEGIILRDVDVTDGTVSSAVFISGIVRVDRLPEAPTAAAVTAPGMNQIQFIADELPYTGS